MPTTSPDRAQPSRLRVLLCDDHQGVRGALRLLLGAEPDLEVVGEAGDGATVLKQAVELKPDVILLDISLPDMTGFAVAGALRRAGTAAKILALSAHEDQGYRDQMRVAGVSGYVVKRRVGDTLVQTIRAVAGPKQEPTPAPPAARPSPAEPESPSAANLLSRAETSIFKHLAAGRTSKQIAQVLGLEVSDVEAGKAQGMSKLGLRTRADVVRFARRCGWLGA
ncbi:MAG TPA: response regulator transcription factor [Pseudomonadota bacterium]|nr:response regulator transcription factor [Pseudomonadota bacterium]